MDAWTDEEIEDFERWERDFEKASEDPARAEWLDWAEIEFEWNKPVPSC